MLDSSSEAMHTAANLHWRNRGRPDGDALTDWLAIERKVNELAEHLRDEDWVRQHIVPQLNPRKFFNAHLYWVEDGRTQGQLDAKERFLGTFSEGIEPPQGWRCADEYLKWDSSKPYRLCLMDNGRFCFRQALTETRYRNGFASLVPYAVEFYVYLLKGEHESYRNTLMNYSKEIAARVVGSLEADKLPPPSCSMGEREKEKKRADRCDSWRWEHTNVYGIGVGHCDRYNIGIDGPDPCCEEVRSKDAN